MTSIHQLLIATTLRNDVGGTERGVYRVDPDATLSSVVCAARNRSELPGDVRCTGLEVLGTLAPHLWPEYTDLLSRI